MPSARNTTSAQNRAPSFLVVLSAVDSAPSGTPGRPLAMVSLSAPSGLAPPSTGVGRAQDGSSFSSRVSTRDWSLTETSPNSATIDSSTFSVPSSALR